MTTSIFETNATRGGPDILSLKDRVRAELLNIRKSPSGLAPGMLSDCPVLSGLLGGGHPGVAYNGLKHRILSTENNLALKAASASLGLTSGKATHLGRLDEFGQEYGYDQRQVRRYSDKGIRQLVELIVEAWSPEASPCLDVHGYQTGPASFAFMIQTRRPYFVDMGEVHTTVYVEQDVAEPLTAFTAEAEDRMWLVARTTEPLAVQVREETSIAWDWKGELFPKLALHWRTDLQGYGITWESLGNRGMARIGASTTT